MSRFNHCPPSDRPEPPFDAWFSHLRDHLRAHHEHHHHGHHGRFRDPYRDAWGAHGHEFGRPRGGEGRGFGGRGRGFPPFGFGGPHGFRAGRKLSSTDLQLVLLALIAEKPSHGYELIKILEERSNGFYVPSPGVIYPALTYLEEAGEARAETEGSRKLYHLTDAGRERLEGSRADVDAMLAQLQEFGRNMDRVREAFGHRPDADDFESFREAWGVLPEVLDAMRLLKQTIAAQRGAPRDRWLRVADALRRAAEEIRESLGDEKRPPSKGDPK